jgi:sugar lactone lactonase YvrE
MNAGESSGSPTASIDVGWAANVNDDGSYTHVGMFRDATDNTFKVFGNYTPEPDAAVEINTGHASFTLAPFAASTLSGEYLGFDSDVTAAGLATQTYVTTRPISTFTNDANYLDSTTVQGVINSSYIQSNQTTYNTSDFADSAFVTSQIAAISIPTLGNDFVDSGQVTSIIDASYIQSNQITYNTSDFADSAFVTSQIAAISIPTLGNDFVDSAQVQLIVDSAYVQLRQTAGGGTVDSADIIAIVDSAYIQARQTTVAAGATTITQYDYEADSGQTTFTGADIDGQSLSYTAGKLAVYLNGILLVDSNDYTATNGSSIVLTSGVDSGDTLSIIAYVTEAVGTLDSAGVTNLIDSAYIQARQLDSAATATNALNLEGNPYTYYLDHNNFSNTPTIPTLGNDFVDSGQVSSIISGTSIDAATLNSQAASYYLDYNNFTNTPTIPTFGNDYVDSAFVTTQVNSLVAGAPGALDTLNELAAALGDDADFATTVTNSIATKLDSAQVIALVDSAYVQLRQTAGGGTVDSADIIAIVDSAYIQLRQSTASSGATTISTFNYEADFGQTTFTGADIDGSTLTYTAGKLNVYLNGVLLVDSNDYTATNGSSIVLNTGADSSDIVSVISYITQAIGTLDSAGVTNLIDSAYVQARQITYTIPTLGNDFVDSGQVTSIIDASYIQSNQTTYNTSDFADSAFVTSQIAAISIPTLGNDFVDSGQVIALVDSAYVQARQSSSSSSTFDLEASNRANYGWHADLSSATNTGTYIFGFNGAATFNGIFWSTDGSYLFEVDGLDDFVRRITVPTPFDISSVTTPYDTSNQIDTTSENAYTEDLWFSPDGLRLVLLGSSGTTDHAVHSYTLTSPWDLTTATYDSKTINVNSTGGGGVAGIHLSPDGRKMFIASNSTDKVHEYTLSTAYDVSTATETRTLDISSQTGGASGIRFNHQGTQMFISDGSNGVIVYQYKLTLPFNVSSASYVTSHTGSSGSGAGKGLAFSPDGAYLHTVGNGRVYEITLTGNVSYATPVVSKDVLAYDSNLQDFVDAFTLPTSDGSANQVLVTNGSGTISFAEQSGGLDSALITQLIDSAYVQLRQTASGGGGGGTDSASVNTLIDAKLQVTDVSDIVGADGNYGEYLKSLGNGEAEWTDLATQAKQKAFAMALIFG